MGAWLRRVAVAAFLSALALRLSPKGAAQRPVRLACGLLTAITLLSAVKSLDTERLSEYLARYRQEAETMLTEEDETRFLIEERTAAYILEKAALPGLTASVRAVWREEGYWLPWEVTLSGAAEEGARRRVEAVCEGELGIPKERIHWKG